MAVSGSRSMRLNELVRENKFVVLVTGLARQNHAPRRSSISTLMTMSQVGVGIAGSGRKPVCKPACRVGEPAHLSTSPIGDTSRKGNLRTLRDYHPGQLRRRRDRHPAGTSVLVSDPKWITSG